MEITARFRCHETAAQLRCHQQPTITTITPEQAENCNLSFPGRSYSSHATPSVSLLLGNHWRRSFSFFPFQGDRTALLPCSTYPCLLVFQDFEFFLLFLIYLIIPLRASQNIETRRNNVSNVTAPSTKVRAVSLLTPASGTPALPPPPLLEPQDAL